MTVVARLAFLVLMKKMCTTYHLLLFSYIVDLVIPCATCGLITDFSQSAVGKHFKKKTFMCYNESSIDRNNPHESLSVAIDQVVRFKC